MQCVKGVKQQFGAHWKQVSVAKNEAQVKED